MSSMAQPTSSSGDESPLGGTRGSAAFLQTLNKYVSYCFDASCDQNNVGSAAVLRDQDWNAIGQRGEKLEQVVIEGITDCSVSILSLYSEPIEGYAANVINFILNPACKKDISALASSSFGNGIR
ncbi:hypothetical protein SO802_013152 [Lithocarpus litseifolius]|uniref:Uncharacterized protein n=1 Tax=Lithocarpus litseifolius TaxID=425828 RepID=A0AAW2D5K0_9ROSI